MPELKDFDEKYAYYIYRQEKVKYGYEIEAVLFDKSQPITDEKDPDYEFGCRAVDKIYLNFPEEPKREDAAENCVKSRIAELAKIIPELASMKIEERVFTEGEVKQMLVNKGYLVDTQELSELKSKSDLLAKDVEAIKE
jgi:hypothetical protein